MPAGHLESSQSIYNPLSEKQTFRVRKMFCTEEDYQIAYESKTNMIARENNFLINEFGLSNDQMSSMTSSPVKTENHSEINLMKRPI